VATLFESQLRFAFSCVKATCYNRSTFESSFAISRETKHLNSH